jgi:hypothetical protein
MISNRYTKVPNFVFDELPNLTEAELKVLLVIIRQTIGRKDMATGQYKTRDWISLSQFGQKTGLCRRVIIKAVQSLIHKKGIRVTGEDGFALKTSEERKGKRKLYFSLIHPVHEMSSTSAQKVPKPVHESAQYKRDFTKENSTKGYRAFSGHIGRLLPYQNMHSQKREPEHSCS